jgi:hypothetical protein
VGSKALDGWLTAKLLFIEKKKEEEEAEGISLLNLKEII